jgi:hypothetical protein
MPEYMNNNWLLRVIDRIKDDDLTRQESEDHKSDALYTFMCKCYKYEECMDN